MTASFSPEQIGASRVKLVLLWMVPFGLMAIAGIVYALVEAGYMSLGSKNEGVLIQPPFQIGELVLTTSTDIEKKSIWQDKWTIVVRGEGGCDQACLDTLYLTRQIHIRLNKEANRVQRVYLRSEAELGAELTALFRAENHYMKIVTASEADLTELDRTILSGGVQDNNAVRFFIVDPDGWAMMYYHQEHNGAVILKDLKHLLKYSKER